MKKKTENTKEENKEKKHQYLSKNKTKESNSLITKYVKKNNKINKKRIKLRNIDNDPYISKTNLEKNTTKNSTTILYSKSNEKSLIRNFQKHRKKKLTNNIKNIKTEYSLCQQEMQLLFEKEEELKLLRNELKLKNNKYKFNIYKKGPSYINNYSKPKSLKNRNEDESRTFSKLNKSYNKAFNLKKNRKNYSMISILNYNNINSINNIKNNTSKNNLITDSNDNIISKKKTIQKRIINKIKPKNNIKINLFPDKTNICNTTDRHLNSEHKYNLSFKNPKRKIISLHKNYYPTSFKKNIFDCSYSMSHKDIMKNSKNKYLDKYKKTNKSNTKNIKSDTSIKRDNKSKTSNIVNLKNKIEEQSKKPKKVFNECINNINTDSEKKNISDKEEEENQMNIRSIDKIGIITKAGEDISNQEKINQDNYFDNDLSNGYKFIGVCDGHGEDGQNVSDYLRNNLPRELGNELKKIINNENKRLRIIESMLKKKRDEKLGNEEKINDKKEGDILIKNIENIETFKDLFKKAFVSTNLKLIEESYMFNLENSGSTCVSILLQKENTKKFYVANVGDSRAIIVKQPIKNTNNEDKNNNIWSFEQLSRDHNLLEKDEADRILKHGGEIQQYQNEKGEFEGPLRIYIKHEEGPGLAMSRSFGDVLGTIIGLIAEPEVTEYIIKKEDKAIIIASDGLWEYVSNEEVTEIVKNLIDKKDPDLIVDELYKFSYEKWKKKDGGIDDITIICILLK